MVPNNTYLLNIGEVYYFRVKVPKNVKGLYGSSHIKKSLHTRNLQTALHRANVIKQLTSMIFKQMESGMVKKNKADEILNFTFSGFILRFISSNNPFSKALYRIKELNHRFKTVKKRPETAKKMEISTLFSAFYLTKHISAP